MISLVKELPRMKRSKRLFISIHLVLIVLGIIGLICNKLILDVGLFNDLSLIFFLSVIFVIVPIISAITFWDFTDSGKNHQHNSKQKKKINLPVNFIEKGHKFLKKENSEVKKKIIIESLLRVTSAAFVWIVFILLEPPLEFKFKIISLIFLSLYFLIEILHLFLTVGSLRSIDSVISLDLKSEDELRKLISAYKVFFSIQNENRVKSNEAEELINSGDLNGGMKILDKIAYKLRKAERRKVKELTEENIFGEKFSNELLNILLQYREKKVS